MSKILITGGSGFIGFHLANSYLKNGDSVDLIDNFTRGENDISFNKLLKHKNCNLIKIDILDPLFNTYLTSNYDYIFHFAAIIGVSNVLKSPYLVLSNNVKMIEILINFAKQNTNLKRFIFTSTSEVYSGTLKFHNLQIPTPEISPLSVNDLNHPRTSYMLSKIYGEALCHQSGLPFTILRPHNIYGERMGFSHVIPELLKKAYFIENKCPIEVASTNHSRTFCYIDDAISQIILAASLSVFQGVTVNIGTQSSEIKILDLAIKITKMVSYDLNKIIDITPSDNAPGSVSRRCPDMSLMYKLSGFISATSLDEGLIKTYEWYKSNSFI